jgi:N utilization substance protein B
MQLIYQMDITSDFSDASRKRFLDDYSADIASSKPDFKYFNQCLAAITEHLSEIDDEIERASENWKLSRITRVDLAILRLAVAEIMYPRPKSPIPHKVSINEAVELAKKFAGDKSPIFVNGVLGRIAADETH